MSTVQMRRMKNIPLLKNTFKWISLNGQQVRLRCPTTGSSQTIFHLTFHRTKRKNNIRMRKNSQPRMTSALTFIPGESGALSLYHLHFLKIWKSCFFRPRVQLSVTLLCPWWNMSLVEIAAFSPLNAIYILIFPAFYANLTKLVHEQVCSLSTSYRDKGL